MVSWLIAKLTGNAYTHAALYFGYGRIVECDVLISVSVQRLTKYQHYDVVRVASATPRERDEAVSFFRLAPLNSGAFCVLTDSDRHSIEQQQGVEGQC
ncbi:hypothetical protein CIG75_17005 [Tumebacillus algifaecis]|uniref:Uncharacterized protein n=1 Tax=Tumebacillus algifaecis TaxID=1214604 RepID=A0A223D4D9_9BACL|nr:hypothetical protein CIG75_17005 [Tumebacillus algifaecis]